MLYDYKRWEKPKADPSLADFIAWLETMPADEYYEFGNPFRCAAAQCLQHYGIERYVRSLTDLREMGWLEIVYPADWLAPRTFGAALARARATLRSS